MIRKFIRALFGKGDEDIEVEVNIELDVVDFLFIIAFIILLIWMLIK